MIIQFVSDVHCEFHKDNGVAWASLLPVEGDVLVLPGDITTYQNMVKVCSILASRFKYVVYVCGNHEYYLSDRGTIHNNLKKLQSRFTNFFWLNNSTITIEGQRFVGSTLWWMAGPVEMITIRQQLNDFGVIKGYSKWVSKENLVSKNFLKENAQSGDVVITHHAPTWEAAKDKGASAWSMYGKVEDLHLDWAYYNNLNETIENSEAKLWLFGHTHNRFEAIIGKTLVANCPHGYTQRNKPDPEIFGLVDLDHPTLILFNGENRAR